MKHRIMSITEIEAAYNNIVQNTCDYLLKYPKIHSLIIGLSGGVDSALVCALAVQVRNKMCYHGIPVEIITRSIPIMSNTDEEIKRAADLGKAFSVDFGQHSLDDLYIATLTSFGEDVFLEDVENNSQFSKIRLGNIKARLRMIYLYNLAQIRKGMVLSTDNYTELLLGFWTLHGDVGDFGMIQNLWKTEVYNMVRFIATEYKMKGQNKISDALMACVNATPTDGLGITSSDLDQLGGLSSYEQVDKIFINALNSGYKNIIKEGGTVPKVLTMYENTMYKRENPYNIPREAIMEM